MWVYPSICGSVGPSNLSGFSPGKDQNVLWRSLCRCTTFWSSSKVNDARMPKSVFGHNSSTKYSPNGSSSFFVFISHNRHEPQPLSPVTSLILALCLSVMRARWTAWGTVQPHQSLMSLHLLAGLPCDLVPDIIPSMHLFTNGSLALFTASLHFRGWQVNGTR